MDNNDFTVYLHERYGMTKDEFVKTMYNSARYILRYEEDSSVHQLPNIDYNKLFVGAKIYIDAAALTALGRDFKEAVVTHLYGGVVFYKFIDGETENHMDKDSFGFKRHVYPKVVVKPNFFEMVCDCDKTKFVNYDD